MTDRFKNASDWLTSLKYKTEYSLGVGKITGADSSPKYKQYKKDYDCIETAIHALTLATESEQLRKERDELAAFIRQKHDVLEVPTEIFNLCIQNR